MLAKEVMFCRKQSNEGFTSSKSWKYRKLLNTRFVVAEESHLLIFYGSILSIRLKFLDDI